MTRMTGPDCVVMCNLINTYIHVFTYVNIYNPVCSQIAAFELGDCSIWLSDVSIFFPLLSVRKPHGTVVGLLSCLFFSLLVLFFVTQTTAVAAVNRYTPCIEQKFTWCVFKSIYLCRAMNRCK